MLRSVLFMEKTNYITMEVILILVILCLCNASVQCKKRSINHLSTPSRSPELQNSLQRIILSTFSGIITGLIFSLLFACIIGFFIRFIAKTPFLKGPVIFSPNIAPKALQSALANQNQLLGSSPNGNYFKTLLDNGPTVAVKRLEPLENGSRKSVKRRMQQDVESIARLRDRNLMSLRAFVREPDRFSLVYDYIPNGSLEDAMNRVRENQLELNWEVRLRIAVGIVKGLQYLHFGCTPRVVHCNLKPSNVILDAEFEPRLTDYGLDKLMPNLELDRAASGYSAPECFQDCRYTDKSDVFSFGVILGVLLTGRDPKEPFFGEAAGGGSLGGWLRHLQEAGEAREVLDKRIIGEEVEKEEEEEEEEEEDDDEILMTVRIAVVCLSDLPEDRPSSDELVSMLTQLHSF
ncbi:inactive leucine-rich repeat receptor-like protein kinase CORYNE [Camellia sinensis]|uniref:inactive leucine-rich repeat receptor-like protein kinase CORYNE n=1 Tax=Camellia sinensis TaxID=4442 RepID=UPI0010356AC2|nr:inactive leucine-rich repeat receptor-like protein kinase CORYNE [Camellia sinensis]